MTRKHVSTVAVVLVLALLLLAACGGSATTPTPGPAAGSDSGAAASGAAAPAGGAFALAGTTWKALAFGSPGDSLAIDPNTTLTLNIGIERYGGSGGCNWFLGSYMVDGDKVTFHEPSQTGIQCTTPANVMQQEATYFSALQNIIEYRKAGDNLAGYTSDNQLLLTFEPAPAVPLEGATWGMKFQLNDADFVPIVSGTTVTADLAGGKISGSAGCNDYTGSYTLAGDAFAVTDLTVTEKACTDPEGIMQQEALFLANLKSGARLVQTSGLVQVLNGADETVLVLGAP